MKKSIRKIWGIGLVVVLLVSIMAMPAAPASAGTLAWTAVGVPNPFLSNQIVAGVNVANVTVAPNGDIFAIDSLTPTTIYKSVNGGYSWTATVTAAATLVDIAISPSYATDSTVFAVDGGAANAQVYISTNGGVSFAVLGGSITAELGTSIAVAPNYSAGNGEVMLGTSDGALGGDVYIWNRNGVQNWTVVADAGFDVYDVAYSPNYPIDGTRLAVVASAAATAIHTLVGSDAAFGGLAATPVSAAVSATMVRASIAFPSDFNASLPLTRTIYVAVDGAVDDVYRVPLTGTTVALVSGIAPASIAYSGTTLAGTLLAGDAASTNVWKTVNPAAVMPTVAWVPNFGAATGTNLAYVALANDFATSGKVYVGTSSAAATNSAFSVSDDGGSYFYQTGLIDTVVAGINDVQYASATEMFMFTNDGLATGDSLWKTTDGGASYNRILSFVAGTNTASVELSPSYATDSTLFIGDTGATGASALRMSNDGGKTWVGRNMPTITVGAIAVKDQYTVYVGSNSVAGVVQMTANGGWTWQPVATAVGGTAISDIALDAGTGHILVGTNAGTTSISINNNVTYIALGVATANAAATAVAFDTDYANNSIVYRADTAGAAATSVIERFQYGTSVAWLSITPTRYVAATTTGWSGPAADMIVAPDGTLYVTDSAAVVSIATGAATGGLNRCLAPTAGTATLSLVEWSATYSAVASTLGTFNLLQGSNVINAVNTAVATGAVVSFTDTMTTAAPIQVSPADGAVFPAAALAVVAWDAVPGALSYRISYSTRADFIGATTTTVANDVATPLSSFVIAPVGGLTAGSTYYWRVRAQTPLLTPYSPAQTFQTQLAPAGPNAPPIAAGAEGTTGPGGWDVSLTPVFSWGAVPGAANFEFQLATDAAMSNVLIDASGADALGAVTAYAVSAPLDNNTTYYWRVRAISATSTTAWSAVNAFTTLAEVVAPAPPVTVTSAPPAAVPTFTMPAPPAATTIEIPPAPAVEEIAPAYIWAIIVIGAVLVIAVIVLIVRTRRSV